MKASASASAAIAQATEMMSGPRPRGMTVLRRMELAARSALTVDIAAPADRVAAAIVRSVGSPSDLRKAVTESLMELIEEVRRDHIHAIEERAAQQRAHEEWNSPEARAARKVEWDAEYARICAEEEARQAVVRERVEAAAAEYAAQVRLELMEKLLDAPFALPDGRRVTWGDATAADHEERSAALVAMAKGTTITAARHLAALALLQAHGVERLRDVRCVAA